MRLLVVEDEEKLARTLLRGLREEGHVVDLAATVEDAASQLRALDYDVVVLDWMLPDGDGVALLRRWRRDGVRTPVLMLTARGRTEERVLGLRAGADDYLPKPFDFDELLARIDALHRRSVGTLDSYRAHGVALDARRRVLSAGEQEVPLTAREFALAQELFSRPGEVLTRAHLLDAVWGRAFEGDPNILDVYVGYLRGKLAKLGDPPPIALRAVRGSGFRLVAGDAP